MYLSLASPSLEGLYLNLAERVCMGSWGWRPEDRVVTFLFSRARLAKACQGPQEEDKVSQ